MSAMLSASRTWSAPERTSTTDLPPTGRGAWRCGPITAPRGGWRSFALRLEGGIDRHGKELEAMLDEPVAQSLGDDAAGLQVDEMVVMVGRHLLVARAAVAEIMARQDVRLLEEAHGAVHGGDADLGIDLVGAAVDGLDIGVIGRVREHAHDDTALLGHLQALIETKLFEPRGHPTRHNWRQPRHYSPQAQRSLSATCRPGQAAR